MSFPPCKRRKVEWEPSPLYPNFDGETWNRARGWALWKALITYNYNEHSNKAMADETFNTIKTILKDYETKK